ncbi:MAG: hypothetical protein U9Q99_03090 [Nanoarchaeota archaeon]|nr:hypothetical protein [Nanoarchaeota archaeon]
MNGKKVYFDLGKKYDFHSSNPRKDLNISEMEIYISNKDMEKGMDLYEKFKEEKDIEKIKEAYKNWMDYHFK